MSLPFAPDRPIVVQLLGTVELRGVVDPDALLSQTKRLALLAYLGAAQPYGFHRRDRIASLFWPEHDQGHARAALRKAVHAIRAAMGEETILSRGDEELSLNADLVWCDVRAFVGAARSEHLARALELYRGPLLDGFYADAPGFERWLEEERERLRESAADAALRLAAVYEGETNLTLATRWARKAARLTPSDERSIRKVMKLLDRAGDRAGALQVFEDFSRTLRTELDVEPDSETRALAIELRREG